MAERFRFFDSIDGEDERYYTADEFAEYFRQLVSSGIFNGGTNLQVVCDGTNMDVSILSGYAWLEGYLYKIDTEPLILTLDAANPALDRIDRVVIRLDKRLEHRYVKAFILKGEPAEEPTAPKLTRDQNIYEISLAQIRVIAGKSFIRETEVLDERFNEDVCGIVNSLIKIDTSHLIKAFEGEWQEWFSGIKDNTFVPMGNLKDGFIRTPDDLFYSIPDSKLQVERGWPINCNAPKMELNSLSLNTDGTLYISEFKEENINIANFNTEATNTGPNLHIDSQLAIPFTVNKDIKYLEITMKLKRESIGRIRSIIYEANKEGLPDITKELGRYFSDNYNELDYNFKDVTWEIPLNGLLKTNKKYFLVLYGYSSSYYINAAYADSPGEINYYISTDKGTTWTSYERTPYLIISGKQLVDEGNVIISYDKVTNFKKHGLINVDIIDNVNSSYTIDILDLDGSVIKEDVKIKKYLFGDNLSKDTKVRIRLIKVGEEEPKLKNYEHLWVADTSHVQIEQAIVPSDNVIISYPDQVRVETRSSRENGLNALKANLSKGGRYRLKCEIRAGSSSADVRLYVFLSSEVHGSRIGYASAQGSSFTPITLDLDSVPPNSQLLLNLGISTTSDGYVYIRKVEICGESGYQEDNIYEAN